MVSQIFPLCRRALPKQESPPLQYQQPHPTSQLLFSQLRQYRQQRLSSAPAQQRPSCPHLALIGLHRLLPLRDSMSPQNWCKQNDSLGLHQRQREGLLRTIQKSLSNSPRYACMPVIPANLPGLPMLRIPGKNSSITWRFNGESRIRMAPSWTRGRSHGPTLHPVKRRRSSLPAYSHIVIHGKRSFLFLNLRQGGAVNNGWIVEQGKHQNLMDARGFYYHPYMSQCTGLVI